VLYSKWEPEMAKKYYTLLIDDLRNLDSDLVARTYEEGIAYLLLHDISILYLDHDLGDPRLLKDEDPSGYSVCLWLEDHPEYCPNSVHIITGNPAGRARMMASLFSMGYAQIGGDSLGPIFIKGEGDKNAW